MNQYRTTSISWSRSILQAVEGPWHMQHAAAAWRTKLGQKRGAPGDQQQPCRAWETRHGGWIGKILKDTLGNMCAQKMDENDYDDGCKMVV